MQYNVKMEFVVSSVDLLNIEVEAESKEEAKQLALEKYKNGEIEEDYYASDSYESSVSIETIKDWEVEGYD